MFFNEKLLSSPNNSFIAAGKRKKQEQASLPSVSDSSEFYEKPCISFPFSIKIHVKILCKELKEFNYNFKIKEEFPIFSKIS